MFLIGFTYFDFRPHGLFGKKVCEQKRNRTTIERYGESIATRRRGFREPRGNRIG